MAIEEKLPADMNAIVAPFQASVANARGNLLWWDGSANYAKKASAYTDTGSLLGNQRAFARLFLGVNESTRLSTQDVAADGPVKLSGFFDCTCASSTFDIGDLVGIDRNSTDSVNYDTQVIKVVDPALAIGVVAKQYTSATTTVRCFLRSVYSHVPRAGSVTNLITDPGNAGAIPVTASGYCPIVTAGSETRTLAVPSFIGQELLLYIKTDGGTCVVTVASAINQTGNNTITMAEVRDVIRLVAIESGSSLVWHVVSNDGAALTTV